MPVSISTTVHPTLLHKGGRDGDGWEGWAGQGWKHQKLHNTIKPQNTLGNTHALPSAQCTPGHFMHSPNVSFCCYCEPPSIHHLWCHPVVRALHCISSSQPSGNGLMDQRRAQVNYIRKEGLTCGIWLHTAQPHRNYCCIIIIIILTCNCFDTPKSASLALSSESNRTFAPGGELEGSRFMLQQFSVFYHTSTHTHINTHTHTHAHAHTHTHIHTPLMSLCTISLIWR